MLKRDTHAPTVGILVCSNHNERTVRYSLGKTSAPMAVSTYTYDTLPPEEQQALPDANHITAALNNALKD
jgi:hypothetical protein